MEEAIKMLLKEHGIKKLGIRLVTRVVHLLLPAFLRSNHDQTGHRIVYDMCLHE